MEQEFAMTVKTTRRENSVVCVKSAVMEMQRPAVVSHAVATNMETRRKDCAIRKQESATALRTPRVKTVRAVRVDFMAIHETAVAATFNVSRVPFFKRLNRKALDRSRVTWMSASVCGC